MGVPPIAGCFMSWKIHEQMDVPLFQEASHNHIIR